MSKKVSMDEIAKLCHVSKVTVSKALNDKEGVSESLRQLIKDKANELGYYMNSAAKSLKLNKNFNIGVIIPMKFIGGSSSYYFETYTKLVVELTQQGYSVLLEILNEVDEANHVLPEMYKNGKIDGLMIMGQLSDDYLKCFENAHLPILLFDFYSYNIDIDSVVIDNFTSGYKATDYLVKKGHKHIGFVGNIYATSSIQDRYLGYCRALLGHHLTINPKDIVSDRDDKGKFKPFIMPDEMPTAFVCNNDQIAYEFIQKLKQMNYQVPEDVSIITFDNTFYSQKSNPQITTLCVDTDKMVHAAVKTMLQKMNKESRYHKVFIQSSLVERDSVKHI
jgi:LacI family transcriptional regulator